MKNLILIRHAKSNWDTPIKDLDRPLEQRGVIDAQIVAANCSPILPSKFTVFSSTAKRAKDTSVIFSQIISYPIESIVFKEELYTFDEYVLEIIIKSLSNTYENVIIFGHNEAITNFVNKFGDIFISNVPTVGLVWIEFTSDNWAKINKGKTKKIIFPKNLK